MAFEWIAAGAGLALVYHRPDRGQEHVQVRRILVDGGYQPAELHVDAGRPIRLTFHRQETAACSQRIVFPDLGISAELPAHQDVTVELPACEPGEHPFRCQMDVLHGSLIVKPAGTAERSVAA